MLKCPKLSKKPFAIESVPAILVSGYLLMNIFSIIISWLVGVDKIEA